MKCVKKLMCTAVAFVLCLALSGCGGMSAKKLITCTTEATAAKQITQSAIKLEMDIAMELDGERTELSMDGTMDLRMAAEPYACYAEMKMLTKAEGQETAVTTQTYVLEENDALVSYIYTDADNSWLKQTLAENVAELSAQSSTADLFAGMAPEMFSLAEETQMVNGRETYVLSCTLTGEEMQKALNSTGGADALQAVGGSESLDLTALNVPASYYLDAESFLPVKIEMDIEGMDEMLDGLMAGAAGDSGAELSCDITKLHIVIDNISFDPAEVPSVPEKGFIIANQASYEPDQGDGSYVIQEGGDAVRVVCPEGWTATDMAYDRVKLENDSGTQSANYTMYTGMSGYGFFLKLEREDAIPLLGEDNYIGHGYGPDINGYATAWVKAADGMNLYYAWNSVGEAFVYIRTEDHAGQSLEAALSPLIEAVSDFQL